MFIFKSIINRCRLAYHKKRIFELQELQTAIIMATHTEAKKHDNEFAQILFRNSRYHIRRIESNIIKHRTTLKQLRHSL